MICGFVQGNVALSAFIFACQFTTVLYLQMSPILIPQFFILLRRISFMTYFQLMRPLLEQNSIIIWGASGQKLSNSETIQKTTAYANEVLNYGAPQ